MEKEELVEHLKKGACLRWIPRSITGETGPGRCIICKANNIPCKCVRDLYLGKASDPIAKLIKLDSLEDERKYGSGSQVTTPDGIVHISYNR